MRFFIALQWRHSECDGVSNHWRLDCLLDCLFRRRSKKTSKVCVTWLCEGNPPVTGRLPSPRASSAQNVSIWWRHNAEWFEIGICCDGTKVYNQMVAHWGRNKNDHHFADDILIFVFINEIVVFWLTFHWNLFPILISTINGNWLR